MIKYFLNRQIDLMEREFGYDAGYARELADAAPAATLAMFLTNQFIKKPREIPLEAWFAAKAAAALHADCGPCVQLGVAMATKAGVSPAVMKALLIGDLDAVDEGTRTVFLFITHAFRRSAGADELREKLVALYGDRAVARLSFAASTVHLFPTLKYVMGHGRTCSRVQIGDESIVVRHDIAENPGRLHPAAA